MTSPIKTTSLFLASVLSSACGWDVIPDEPPGDATGDADAPDDGNNEPTTGAETKNIFVHF